jgi:ATP-dependent HslUV protease ATP-binding subunit HslU
MEEFTPREIVAALDRFIIGQDAAKRSVAIAIRNRWRRLQLSDEIRRDVHPKNILMVGPTGVGKTEIARRLAQLLRAPFVKVEATKFTEVGYHGRDVDSIVRDLMERAIAIEREVTAEAMRERAAERAEDHVIDQLLPSTDLNVLDDESVERRQRTREKLREQLRAGGLSERSIEVQTEEKAVSGYSMNVMGFDQMGPEFEQFMDRIMPRQTKRRRLSVPEALEILTQQEIDRMIDPEDAPRGRDSPGRADWDRLPGRARQDLRQLSGRRRTPMSHAAACSATCSRWSKARPSTPAMGW